MTKVLKCGDVVRGRKEEIKGDSEHDVLRKAAEHAKTAHHMDSIPPERTDLGADPRASVRTPKTRVA